MGRNLSNKIAIVFPEFHLGGAEALTLWTIEALKSLYDIYLITASEIDLSLLNNIYGTSLKQSDFSVVKLPIPIFLKSINKFLILKQHFAMRYCKYHISDFDIFFSTFNEMDFGKPGIQYIHFPILEESIAREMQFMSNSFVYKDTFLRRIYKELGVKISGFSLDSMKENITLTNSHWTSKVIQKTYGITPKVVYPPVVGNFPIVSWDKRENGFVCVGRITPEKRIENIINTLHSVRESGYNIHLHIIGKLQNSDYGKKILKLIKENSSWVILNEGLSRDEMLKVLANHKYGIHAMPKEHFGLAVAEMVRAGEIVFVPNDGGQVEIVGNNQSLVYENSEDAVKKIIKVLSDDELQYSLREFLSIYANEFTLEKFEAKIREIVSNALRVGG